MHRRDNLVGVRPNPFRQATPFADTHHSRIGRQHPQHPSLPVGAQPAWVQTGLTVRQTAGHARIVDVAAGATASTGEGALTTTPAFTAAPINKLAKARHVLTFIMCSPDQRVSTGVLLWDWFSINGTHSGMQPISCRWLRQGSSLNLEESF